MITLLLDTNILISALLSPSGKCDTLIREVIQRKISMVLSYEVLTEYKKTLEKLVSRYPKKISSYQKVILLKQIQTFAYHVDISQINIADISVRDRSDEKIIKTAIAGNADYIITGDLDLLVLKQVQNIPILTPDAFLFLFSS